MKSRSNSGTHLIVAAPSRARGARRRGALASLRPFVLSAVGLGLGCGGATPGGGPKVPIVECKEGAAACAEAVQRGLERSSEIAGLVGGYLEARRQQRGDDDAWVELWDRLGEVGDAKVLLLGYSGEVPGTVALSFAPTDPGDGFSAATLLWAMGEAAGLHHVVLLDGGVALHIFPDDPLVAFRAGLPAVVSGKRDRIADDVWLADAVRRAESAAGAFDYVTAAAAVDELTKVVAGRDPNEETVLRANVLVSELGSAGLQLVDEEEEEEDEATEGAVAEPEPPNIAPAQPTDTPLGDYLRVRLASDKSAAYRSRRDSILSAVPSDRHPQFDRYFDPPEDCTQRPAPVVEGPQDLPFSGVLPMALAAGLLEPSKAPDSTLEKLDFASWFKRYEQLVDAVERTHSGWAYMPTLLNERGQSTGLSPQGGALYGRVTRMAGKHIAGLQALQSSDPVGFQPMSLLALTYARGALMDPDLQSDLIELSRSAAQDKLAQSKDAEGVLLALVTGVVTGFGYPPALQQTHFNALQSAFVAKLRGDLASQQGWGMAALYGIDGAYRFVFDQGPDLSRTADEMIVALRGEGMDYPSVAALLRASLSYAKLAAGGSLSAQVLTDGRAADVRSDRVDARTALRDAIAGLAGEGEQPPARLVEDVADLTDGFIAATLLWILETPADQGVQCGTATSIELPPNVRAALAKLADKRRAIVNDPAFTEGDAMWSRRARVLVTVISDLIDAAQHYSSGQEGPVAFTIDDRRAEAYVEAALTEVDLEGLPTALAGAYGLVRQLGAATDYEELAQNAAPQVFRMIRGLAELMSDDGQGTQGGVALFELLSQVDFNQNDAANIESVMQVAASDFYERGRADQADLLLLAATIVTGMSKTPPSSELVALAKKHQSRVFPLMQAAAEMRKLQAGQQADATSYAAGLKEAQGPVCGKSSIDQLGRVFGAIADFREGQRSEARSELDAFLSSAISDGLIVSRLGYTYREETETRVFNLQLLLSTGSVLLASSNTFQVGFGYRSVGAPMSELTLFEQPPDAPEVIEDTGKYFTHAAALSSVYHFLEGDEQRGAEAARHAVQSAVFGVRLGDTAYQPQQGMSWGFDARGTMAVAAQLAGEAGYPFLAGDLWTVVNANLSDGLDDEGLVEVLDPPPTALDGVEGMAAVLDRTQKSLGVLASKDYACIENKPNLATYAQVSCDQYPVAVSLRIADRLTTLPRLRKGAESESQACAAYATLDTFLGELENGTYDPDSFLGAVSSLRDIGHPREAAILFSRHRQPVHCSQQVVGLARELSATGALDEPLSADLLSTSVNCSLGAIDDDVLADVRKLRETSQRLADPLRAFQLLLFTAAVADQTGDYRLLHAATEGDDFLAFWMRLDAPFATAALALHHAARAAASEPIATGDSEHAYRLLCEVFSPVGREDLCAQAKALRGEASSSRQAAEETVRLVVKTFLE